MKRCMILLLAFLLVLPSISFAETGYAPYDYLVGLGYDPEPMYESPGWKTCNLMGGNGWWTLTISDESNSWSLMALPEFNPTFKLEEFQQLFIDLVEKFEWDVSFYWPDYDNGAKMAISYNIVRDIDNTLENHMNKTEYTESLCKSFDIEYTGNVPFEPISISGSGTVICEEVNIQDVPARFSFVQQDVGEFDIWCILNSEDYSVVSGSYNETSGITNIPTAGDYTFLVESANDWEMCIEPLPDAVFEPISASGDYVSDIYTFDKACIVTANANFISGDNFIVHAYIETDYGWDKEYLINELESDGIQSEYKAILKISKPSRVYFVVDFDKGEWTMDVI